MNIYAEEKLMKCKITGVYQCQPKPFTKPINLEIINIRERSASGRIVSWSEEDDFLARKLSFVTNVSFKNIWREVQAPTMDVKPNTRKGKNPFGNKTKKGAIYQFIDEGKTIAEGTILELASKTGCSRDRLYHLKYHGTNKKVVLK